MSYSLYRSLVQRSSESLAPGGAAEAVDTSLVNLTDYVLDTVGTGVSGYSGYSGYSGASGYSGYSGAGASGYSGYSGGGASGYSGYSGTGGSPGGSNTQVQYNNSGSFGGSADLVWDDANNTLTLKGGASQSANILNVTDDVGTTYFAVDSTGRLLCGLRLAAADDPTNNYWLANFGGRMIFQSGNGSQFQQLNSATDPIVTLRGNTLSSDLLTMTDQAQTTTYVTIDATGNIDASGHICAGHYAEAGVGGTYAPASGNFNSFHISFSGSSETINAPSNPTAGQRITVHLKYTGGSPPGSFTLTGGTGGFRTAGSVLGSLGTNETAIVDAVYTAVDDKWDVLGVYGPYS